MRCVAIYFIIPFWQHFSRAKCCCISTIFQTIVIPFNDRIVQSLYVCTAANKWREHIWEHCQHSTSTSCRDLSRVTTWHNFSVDTFAAQIPTQSKASAQFTKLGDHYIEGAVCKHVNIKKKPQLKSSTEYNELTVLRLCRLFSCVAEKLACWPASPRRSQYKLLC